MADLNKLFGNKKETPNEEAKQAPVESTKQVDSGEAKVEGAEAGSKSVSDGASGVEKAKPLGFLKNAGVGVAAAKSSSGSGVSASSKSVVPDSLDDLANLEIEGKAPKKEREVVAFPDMVEATAPIRELPENLDKTQRDFVELMDSVYDVIHEPDLLGGVIKRIMIELKSQAHLMKLVADDDIQTWIRSMRETMGLAKIQKAAKKTTRGRSKKIDADMLSDLEELGIGLGDGGSK